MKVIDQPNWSQWKTIRTCDVCNATLEIEQTDISSRFYDGYCRDESYWQYVIKCPVCATELSVPKSELPEYIRKLVQSRVKS
jgi:hypothetical protein